MGGFECRRRAWVPCEIGSSTPALEHSKIPISGWHLQRSGPIEGVPLPSHYQLSTGGFSAR